MKKKKIVLFVFLIVGVLSLILTYKFKQDNLSKNKPVKEEKLSIMIKEDGSTEYTKSSSKDIPKGNYVLNEEKTHCENNGEVVSYDNVNGIVGFSFIGSDKCYLYFDYYAGPKLYDTIAKRYSNNDEYVKLYNGSDYGDTTNYAKNIYYFNGAVENNNVLFANYCWKIVRTTDTGGVKMIYNGEQKDFYTSNPLNQSEYLNLSNDASFPYVFDTTNKTWTSTNTGTNSSTISFTAPSNGDYVINYDLSMRGTSGIDVKIFKDDVSKGSLYGRNVGQIVFKDLTTTNVIKVVYTRKSDGTTGSRNNVIFSFGKANELVKTCNNYHSKVSSDAYFSDEYNSPAYVGYMYNKNKIYTYSSKDIIGCRHFVGQRAYADSVTYNSSTNRYSLGINATTSRVNSSNISTLVGKYTCDMGSTTSTCNNAYYIVDYVYDDLHGVYIYYYLLSNGDINGKDNGSNYLFGSSFTYTNGIYTLADTTTINTDNWANSYNNINTHHYTCLTNDNTCTSIYYIYHMETFSNDVLYYITLTNGKSVDDALNEMLYDDDVNTDNSRIKQRIDDWYKSNMTSYTDKLEDTVFCNDRSISIKGGWDPNGGSANTDLQFKNRSTNYSLACENKNDRFTVSASNGNGALTYPVGLLTAPEAWLVYKDSNYSTYYLNSGSSYWLVSPANFSARYYAYGKTLDDDQFYTSPVSSQNGVRPVVSLNPDTIISSGDGSYTIPFVIN